MITGMEIRNQQFRKKMRGYDPEEVKNFIFTLAQDFENLYSENVLLRENIQKARYELDQYHKLEDTMNNSLILAQQTAEMIKTNAQKEADMILAQSRQKIAEAFLVYQEVLQRLNLMTAEIKAQLSGELEMLEKSQRKTEELSEFFFSKDIKVLLEKLNSIAPEEKQ
ncbi:MAG: DivIVA domain-containing protein [Syntrophomonadaceae bacterium]|nr:DivIVA domain-containing protein [Syntrophomonadaceae bacterium]